MHPPCMNFLTGLLYTFFMYCNFIFTAQGNSLYTLRLNLRKYIIYNLFFDKQEDFLKKLKPLSSVGTNFNL